MIMRKHTNNRGDDSTAGVAVKGFRRGILEEKFGKWLEIGGLYFWSKMAFRCERQAAEILRQGMRGRGGNGASEGEGKRR